LADHAIGRHEGSIGRSACLPKERKTNKRRPMPEPVVKSPTDARSASKEGVVRYVLAASLGLVIVLFAIGFVMVRHHIL
jgi:hypothetical protein